MREPAPPRANIGGVTSTNPKNIVVLVSGSGTLLQAILDGQDESYSVSLVLADTPCQALERARRAGVATQVIDMTADRDSWNHTLAVAAGEGNPDLIVSAGFMRILGAAFLDRFGGRIINTHPALLPSFPGAHGVRDALAYGVKVTGSTVHFVDEGVDTGPIIAQEAVVIAPDDTEESLHERIKQVERKLIVSVLRRAQIDRATGEVSVQS
ncbi:Phosphoribosylglycinamide formyltransferase [Corynebacterium occultum]|uniref:Phosphoribosylglycinamide formyltransferase n=1 Tax=Corynebacterium occultum TaxID=2675219 RepID=A0A6B8VUF4_9CORY|nr:phosphoribosylglycinamide formyltransferase [Corynebacterium occultum]QGU06739.1 Phosphoribosylglycinamide formyltransferase [Corynebacterium occultum]